MSNIAIGIFGLTLLSVILSGWADTILSATWAKSYFTSGLVVFSRYIPVELHHSNVPSSLLLNHKTNSFWMGKLIFRELDVNQYGFRQKFFAFAPTMQTHGLLIFDFENNLVIVKSYAAWSVVASSIMFIIVLPFLWLISEGPHTEDAFQQWGFAVLAYCFITGISLLIERYQLEKITRMVVELWSKKYVKSTESA
jgi:hypothetical protein